MLPCPRAFGIIRLPQISTILPTMRLRCLFLGICLVPVMLGGCGGRSVVPDAQPMPGAVARAQPSGNGAAGGNRVPAVVGVPNAAVSGATHRISAGDVLEIEVFQADELSTTERVNDAGSIVLPLINAVPVAGLTTDEAERRIAAALARDYLQNPQVNVFVAEFADMEISVGGAVEAPGVFPLTGRTTLLEGIALAGGTTRYAKEDEVVVFRSTGNSTDVSAYVVDLKKIERGELSDPLLAANDKIVVPKSGTRVFFRDFGDTMRGFISLNPLMY